ncbi:MAG: chlorite dismutase family protein [Myxococcaceae bacterium]|nr:chlorite dismutase family protein [Myxococcaceae bacterium]
MEEKRRAPTLFTAGTRGAWRIDHVIAVRGEALPAAAYLDVASRWEPEPGAAWALRGTVSSGRYTERREKAPLDAASPPLARSEASRACLIPLTKSPAWWALTQDERRAIFEERSRHLSDSMRFLPRVARRLYHSRDLGEPFDFVTWFEFAPEHEPAFDELLHMLRSREEWTFVDREVEVRLTRATG